MHLINHPLQLFDLIQVIFNFEVPLLHSLLHLLLLFLSCFQLYDLSLCLFQLLPLGIVDFLQFLALSLEMLDFLEYLIKVFEPRRHLRLYHGLLHLYLGGVGRHLDPLHLEKQLLLDLLETGDLPLHGLDLLRDRFLLLSRLLQSKLLVLKLLEPLVQVLLLLMDELPVLLHIRRGLVLNSRRFLLLILLLFFRGCWGA